jgi:type II secretory pathway component PulK
MTTECHNTNLWSADDSSASGLRIDVATNRRHSKERGSALIAVFWMIFVLGMVLFGATKALHADTEYTRMMRGRIFAKRYAEAGIELARHPAMQQDDPLLHFNSDDDGGFDVTLKTEEARLNINHLLQTGDKVLLRRLFNRWGFKPEFTAALCDALKDWVDADSNASLNGAEKREYEKAGFDGMPFNRPFKEVEEMLNVRGMDIVNAERPDWREWFTVYGDGRIDINDASAEVISLIGDVPMDRVQPLLTFRAGRFRACRRWRRCSASSTARQSSSSRNGFNSPVPSAASKASAVWAP